MSNDGIKEGIDEGTGTSSEVAPPAVSDGDDEGSCIPPPISVVAT